MSTGETVFLFDVDNTLLDNDRVTRDLDRHLTRTLDEARRQRYWSLLAQVSEEVGYRDYLGALQRLRAELPTDIDLVTVSYFMVDYPFANRLFPGALDVLERFAGLGRTVVLSDGDVVFQPRKIMRSGIHDAVDGRVLIYIHKERVLDDVERRYPAAHYVLVDDKPRILAAIKRAWGERVTTVFPRQGHYALDAGAVAAAAPFIDIQVDRIGDLAQHDLGGRVPASY